MAACEKLRLDDFVCFENTNLKKLDRTNEGRVHSSYIFASRLLSCSRMPSLLKLSMMFGCSSLTGLQNRLATSRYRNNFQWGHGDRCYWPVTSQGTACSIDEGSQNRQETTTLSLLATTKPAIILQVMNDVLDFTLHNNAFCS